MIAPRLNSLFLAVALALVLSGVGRWGRAEDAEKIDPAQIRFIAPTAATSTCIGDPRTPVCAVETVMACALRVDNRLCEKVGITDYQLPDKQASSFQYRVLSIRIIQPEDVRSELENVDWWKPGFAEIVIHETSTRLPWCSEGCKKWYTAKPTNQGWHVMEWSLQGNDT